MSQNDQDQGKKPPRMINYKSLSVKLFRSLRILFAQLKEKGIKVPTVAKKLNLAANSINSKRFKIAYEQLQEVEKILIEKSGALEKKDDEVDAIFDDQPQPKEQQEKEVDFEMDATKGELVGEETENEEVDFEMNAKKGEQVGEETENEEVDFEMDAKKGEQVGEETENEEVDFEMDAKKGEQVGEDTENEEVDFEMDAKKGEQVEGETEESKEQKEKDDTNEKSRLLVDQFKDLLERAQANSLDLGTFKAAHSHFQKAHDKGDYGKVLKEGCVLVN